MEYRRYESVLAREYARAASRYRQDDEIEARSENHQRLGGNLRRLCLAFSRPIRVLEIGCGTGRYFHWLENVKLLVGTDLSAEMLKEAEHPVCAQEITVREIRLLVGNVYEMDFEPESFDFIYSLGMFGYGAVLTPQLCAKLMRWLSPGGRVYFDAIERRDFGSAHRFKRAVRNALLPFLPEATRKRFIARAASSVPIVNHTRAEVETLMEEAGFAEFAISSNSCHSPLWRGTHLECTARKKSEARPGDLDLAFDLAAITAVRGRTT